MVQFLKTLPLALIVVFQELAVDALLLQDTGKDGIENSCSRVDLVDWCLEQIRLCNLAGFCERVFIIDPTSVNRIHKDAMTLRQILSRGPCQHVQRSLRHVGLRVVWHFVAIEFT